MADVSSDRLGLLLMEEGTHANEWGDLTNLNLDRLDSASRGFISIALSGDLTLDANDILTVASVAQENSFFAFIEFTGTASTVTVPAENIMWFIRNKTGGTITFTPAGGTGVTLSQDTTNLCIYGANGTTMTNVTTELTGLASNVINAPSGNLTSLTVQSALNELQTDVDTRELAGVAVAMSIALG